MPHLQLAGSKQGPRRPNGNSETPGDSHLKRRIGFFVWYPQTTVLTHVEYSRFLWNPPFHPNIFYSKCEGCQDVIVRRFLNQKRFQPQRPIHAKSYGKVPSQG